MREYEGALHRRQERKLWLSFAPVALLVALVALLAGRLLHDTIADKDSVIFEHSDVMLQLERLNAATQLAERSARSYLLTGDQHELDEYTDAQRASVVAITALAQRFSAPHPKHLLERVLQGEAKYRRAMDDVVSLRLGGASLDAVSQSYAAKVHRERERLDQAMDELVSAELSDLEAAKAASSQHAATTYRVLVAAAVIAILLSAGLALSLLSALRELRRRQLSLENALESMEKKNRHLDAFAGRIAHDLRNLLAPLPTIALALERCDDSTAAKLGERVQRVVERAATTMSALLAFSRAGQPVDGEQTANVAHTVTEVLEDLRPQVEALGATITVQVGDHQVRCSKGLLQTVLSNLLGNALKFMDGRDERAIAISASAHGAWCELSVADSGPGIAEADRTRVFEPFYRVPGTRAPGSGVGLATVQRIVEAHGGQVTLESELGRGSTFIVRLPAAELRSAPPAQPAQVLSLRSAQRSESV